MTRRAHTADGPHVVDFQHIRTGGFFSDCVHPTREAAEQFAVEKLVTLGEERHEAEHAAALASYTAADALTYAVRIYPVTHRAPTVSLGEATTGGQSTGRTLAG